MKKIILSRINVIILLVLTLCLLIGATYILFVNNGLLNKRYDTPQEALKSNKSLNIDDTLKILEDNDYALAVYKDKEVIKFEYLNLNNLGWEFILKKNLNLKLLKQTDGYTLSYNKYKNKHIFLITASSLTVKEIVTPVDNIYSSFKFFKAINHDTTFDYWFLVLDKIPSNYQLIINGKTIYTN